VAVRIARHLATFLRALTHAADTTLDGGGTTLDGGGLTDDAAGSRSSMVR
jgi:hypothetical protein